MQAIRFTPEHRLLTDFHQHLRSLHEHHHVRYFLADVRPPREGVVASWYVYPSRLFFTTVPVNVIHHCRKLLRVSPKQHLFHIVVQQILL